MQSSLSETKEMKTSVSTHSSSKINSDTLFLWLNKIGTKFSESDIHFLEVEYKEYEEGDLGRATLLFKYLATSLTTESPNLRDIVSDFERIYSFGKFIEFVTTLLEAIANNESFHTEDAYNMAFGIRKLCSTYPENLAPSLILLLHTVLPTFIRRMYTDSDLDERYKHNEMSGQEIANLIYTLYKCKGTSILTPELIEDILGLTREGLLPAQDLVAQNISNTLFALANLATFTGIKDFKLQLVDIKLVQSLIKQLLEEPSKDKKEKLASWNLTWSLKAQEISDTLKAINMMAIIKPDLLTEDLMADVLTLSNKLFSNSEGKGLAYAHGLTALVEIINTLPPTNREMYAKKILDYAKKILDFDSRKLMNVTFNETDRKEIKKAKQNLLNACAARVTAVAGTIFQTTSTTTSTSVSAASGRRMGREHK